MRLAVYVNDILYSDSVAASSLEISKDISNRISTASCTFIFRGPTARYDSGGGSRFDSAILDVAVFDGSGGDVYDVAVYGADVRELDVIRIEDANLGTRHFSGYISRLQYKREAKNLVKVTADCSDYTVILDRTVVPSVTFTGQSDQSIIQAVVSTYCPQISSLTANIQVVTPFINSYAAEAKTVRQIIEEICDLSGAEWRVDYNKNLLYFAPATYPAPFGLSSSPNNSTSFGIDAFTEYSRDFIKPINRCTVIGGLLPGGGQINVTYDDSISQIYFGVQAYTIVDRTILVGSDAMLRAKATVMENAYPQESFSLTTFKDGLDIGQTLSVIHSDYGIQGQYIIRSIRLSQASRTVTKYELDLGVQPPDAVQLLRVIEARSRQLTQVPTAVPAAGSVSDISISPSGISAQNINSVNAQAIIGQIDAINIGSINAASIAGVIDASNIGNINATSIQGVIVSSQVADNLIDRLAMYADALRPIPSLTSFPGLPDPAYPGNAVIYRKDLGSFYRVFNNAWSPIAESGALTGKLEYVEVGKITAGSIIGLIAAANIGSVNASSIVGAIDADHIGGIYSYNIQGVIGAHQIVTVNADSIQGTINAVNIGNITATQITSVNATTITIGQLQDGQIAGVSAGKITAGTITASISLTAPAINGGTIFLTSGSSSLTYSSGGFLIQDTGFTGNATFMTNGTFSVRNTSAVVCQLFRGASNAGGLTISSASGTPVVEFDGSLGVTGAAGALAGYLNVRIAGTTRRIPYYN